MRRFIRYLYEYDQGKRMRNVGFVKVEREEEVCVVHIHSKGFLVGNGKELSYYFFFVKEGQCIAIPYGKKECQGPALNEVLQYDKSGTDFSEYFDEMNGVILENEQGQRFAAVWDDSPVDISQMKIYERRRFRQEESAREEKEKQRFVQEEPALEEEEEKELAQEEAAREEERQKVTQEAFSAVESERFPGMQISLTTPTQRYRVRKIQRTEISKLARCEWKLANNNFLLHGYYNYHHLVFLENDSQFMLGVPGIYHEKEAKAAEIFGFPTFVSLDEMEISLTADEKNEEETFGYWCRPVKRHVRWE